MISAHWETPIQNQESHQKTQNVTFMTTNQDSNIAAIDLDKLIKSLMYENIVKPPKQLNLFTEIETSGLISNKVIYDPTGPVPFPKTHDLDDKTISTDPDVIGKLLAKYSIVCPGAESLEISQDSSDPLVTVFTIKKTFF